MSLDALASGDPLVYVANHMAMFPLKPRDKAPLTEHGCKDASKDPAQIRDWQRRYPGCNWGWALDATHVAIDNDIHKGGAESLRALQSQHGPLPLTLRSVTGTGGQHWFYRLPPEVRVKNRAGIVPGIDTRSSGGYVVTPNGIHPEGGVYRWDSLIAPVLAPDWLIALITAGDKPTQPIASAPHAKASAKQWASALATLCKLATEVALAPEGRRNDMLNRAAFLAGRMVGGGQIGEAEVIPLLRAAGLACGLPTDEIKKVLGR